MEPTDNEYLMDAKEVDEEIAKNLPKTFFKNRSASLPINSIETLKPNIRPAAIDLFKMESETETGFAILATQIFPENIGLEIEDEKLEKQILKIPDKSEVKEDTLPINSGVNKVQNSSCSFLRIQTPIGSESEPLTPNTKKISLKLHNFEKYGFEKLLIKDSVVSGDTAALFDMSFKDIAASAKPSLSSSNHILEAIKRQSLKYQTQTTILQNPSSNNANADSLDVDNNHETICVNLRPPELRNQHIKDVGKCADYETSDSSSETEPENIALEAEKYGKYKQNQELNPESYFNDDSTNIPTRQSIDNSANFYEKDCKIPVKEPELSVDFGDLSLCNTNKEQKIYKERRNLREWLSSKKKPNNLPILYHAEATFQESIHMTPKCCLKENSNSILILTVNLDVNLIPYTSNIWNESITKLPISQEVNIIRKWKPESFRRNHLSLSYIGILSWLLSLVEKTPTLEETLTPQLRTLALLQSNKDDCILNKESSCKEAKANLTALVKMVGSCTLQQVRQWLSVTTISQLLAGVERYQTIWNPDKLVHHISQQPLSTFIEITLLDYRCHGDSENQLEFDFLNIVKSPGFFWNVSKGREQSDANFVESWTKTIDFIKSASNLVEEEPDTVLFDFNDNAFKGQAESALMMFELPIRKKESIHSETADLFSQVFCLLAGLQAQSLSLAGIRLGWLKERLQPVMAVVFYGPKARHIAKEVYLRLTRPSFSMKSPDHKISVIQLGRLHLLTSGFKDMDANDLTKWFGPRMIPEELHKQWNIIAMNEHSWLSVIEPSDIILLISSTIRSMGWIIDTAFSTRGYRLVSVTISSAKHLQSAMNPEIIAHLREHFDPIRLTRFMKITKQQFGIVVLRRVGAFRYSKRLISDLYRQYKWDLLNTKLPSGDLPSSKELFLTMRFTPAMLDIIHASQMHSTPELVDQGLFHLELPNETPPSPDCRSVAFIILPPSTTLDQISCMEAALNLPDQYISLEDRQALRFSSLLDYLFMLRLGEGLDEEKEHNISCLGVKWLRASSLSDSHWLLLRQTMNDRRLPVAPPRSGSTTCQGVGVILAYGQYLRKLLAKAPNELKNAVILTDNLSLVTILASAFFTPEELYLESSATTQEILPGSHFFENASALATNACRLKSIGRKDWAVNDISISFTLHHTSTPRDFLKAFSSITNALYNCRYQLFGVTTNGRGQMTLIARRANGGRWLHFLRKQVAKVQTNNMELLSENELELAQVLREFKTNISDEIYADDWQELSINLSDESTCMELYHTISGDEKYSKPVTDLGLIILREDVEMADWGLFVPRLQEDGDVVDRRQRLEEASLGAQASAPLLNVLTFMQNRKLKLVAAHMSELTNENVKHMSKLHATNFADQKISQPGRYMLLLVANVQQLPKLHDQMKYDDAGNPILEKFGEDIFLSTSQHGISGVISMLQDFILPGYMKAETSICSDDNNCI